MNEELLLQALELEDQERPDAEPAQADRPATIEPVTGEQPQKSLLQRAGDVWKSVGGGIAKAGMETKDFVFGEPAEEDKWQIRKDLERRSTELNSESAVNAAASGVAQIVTGLVCAQPGPERGVIVFGDNDENFAGHAAAYALANKLQNLNIAVSVEIPANGDWNDVLKQQRGIAA